MRMFAAAWAAAKRDALSNGGCRSRWRAGLPVEHQQMWSAERVDAAAHTQRLREAVVAIVVEEGRDDAAVAKAFLRGYSILYIPMIVWLGPG